MALGVLVDGDGVLERLAEQTARQNADMDVGSAQAADIVAGGGQQLLRPADRGLQLGVGEVGGAAVGLGCAGEKFGGDDLEGNRKR